MINIKTMEKLAEEVKTKVPSKAKIRVIWEDNPENYTQERAKRIAKRKDDVQAGRDFLSGKNIDYSTIFPEG